MAMTKECEMMVDELVDRHTQIQDLSQLDAKSKKNLTDSWFKEVIRKRTPLEKFAEYTNTWILHGYLLNTGQIFANVYSAAVNAFITPLVKEMGTLVLKGTGSQTERRIGEGLAMYKSAFKNFNDRLKIAAETFDTGHSKNDKLLGEVIGVDEKGFKEWIAANSVSPEYERALRQALVDIYGSTALPGKVGRLYSVGARAGVALDEFNHLMFKQMEFDSLVYRAAPDVAKREKISEAEAIKQLSESVKFGSDEYEGQIRKALARMGYESPSKALALMESAAAESVFRGSAGSFLQTMMKLRRNHPLIGAITMPFVKTPALIVNEGIAWVPFAGMLHRKAYFDPTTGKVQGTTFAAFIPERRADLAAKQVMGTAALMLLGSYVDDNKITGTNPPAGMPRHSVKIGDTWYSYARIEPIATLLGLGVDFHTIKNQALKDPELGKDAIDSLTKYGAMFGKSFVDNVANKSFFQGLANVVAAIEDPERKAATFFQSFANFIVPSGVAQVAKIVDPQEREFVTFMDRIARRIPFVSKGMAPKYDETGQPVQQSLMEVISGIKTKTPNSVAASLEAYGFDLKPTNKKLYGVDIDATALSLVRKTAGNYFTMQVEYMMKDRNWKNLDESMQEFMLKSALSKARAAANREVAGYLIVNDAKFREAYMTDKMMQKGLRDDLLRQQGRLQ